MNLIERRSMFNIYSFIRVSVADFYQFVLGWINLFNFTKSLNNMKTLGNFLGRWAFGGLGG